MRQRGAVERVRGGPRQTVSVAGRTEELADQDCLAPPDSTSDQAGVPLLDEDYLILSTIHSAKGQEWKSVYVLNVAVGPGRRDFCRVGGKGGRPATAGSAARCAGSGSLKSETTDSKRGLALISRRPVSNRRERCETGIIIKSALEIEARFVEHGAVTA